jgi:hypothetical protein
LERLAEEARRSADGDRLRVGFCWCGRCGALLTLTDYGHTVKSQVRVPHLETERKKAAAEPAGGK